MIHGHGSVAEVAQTSGRISKGSKLRQARLPIGPLSCIVWGLIAALPATADELSQGWSASPAQAVASEAVRDGQLVQRHPSGAFGDGVLFECSVEWRGWGGAPCFRFAARGLGPARCSQMGQSVGLNCGQN